MSETYGTVDGLPELSQRRHTTTVILRVVFGIFLEFSWKAPESAPFRLIVALKVSPQC
jgi:hypothetical protein